MKLQIFISTLYQEKCNDFKKLINEGTINKSQGKKTCSNNFSIIICLNSTCI
ncbi:hypothetical protein pb186bvf_017402 [Paramecium bursaria]